MKQRQTKLCSPQNKWAMQPDVINTEPLRQTPSSSSSASRPPQHRTQTNVKQNAALNFPHIKWRVLTFRSVYANADSIFHKLPIITAYHSDGRLTIIGETYNISYISIWAQRIFKFQPNLFRFRCRGWFIAGIVISLSFIYSFSLVLYLILRMDAELQCVDACSLPQPWNRTAASRRAFLLAPSVKTQHDAIACLAFTYILCYAL